MNLSAYFAFFDRIPNTRAKPTLALSAWGVCDRDLKGKSIMSSICFFILLREKINSEKVNSEALLSIE
ncbi:MAG: hypothetical protein AAGA60_02180 [Cyanobacteria bacterium P01_E01_bin.42]